VSLSLPPESSQGHPPRPEGMAEDVCVFPVSFAQERLWFLDQFEPGSPFYNIPAAVRLEGRPDAAALARALSLVARRHESLRTTFASLAGRPVQLVHPPSAAELPVSDLRRLAPAEARAAAERLAAEEARRPFDLSRGPLLRARLLLLPGGGGALLLTMHHIVSDGWSMGLLFRELGEAYESERRGRPLRLPELPVQYADFAQWQRRRLAGPALSRLLSYWRGRLSGAPPLLELPADRPRPPAQGFRGATRLFSLGAGTSAALKALAQREGVTLFMALLAAFKALLYRYTGRADLVVGTPIAGRDRRETEGLIGFFVNTLVLRTDLSGDPSFRRLLARVREVTLGAYEHQELPFERLVEELQPERSLSHNPLFQVLFSLQNTPTLRDAGSQSSLESLQNTPQLGVSRFDLALFTEEVEDGIIAGFEYSTDLFEAATIDRMVGHFQTLVEAAVADPDRRLSELPLLNEAERRQLLREWNATEAEYPAHACVHQLFEEQAERTPEAAAVVMRDRSWTYREVNERANRIAHYLRGRGVGPDVCVGICLERSPNLVAAMLGVLKAGGAYVPLDPAYPAERLAFIVSDSQARVILSEGRLAETLPTEGGRVFRLDADWEVVGRESDRNPPPAATLDNLAYVIYTSGSTGRPKGVAMSHRPLVNLLCWQRRNLPAREGLRVLQFASPSFDVSFQEVFSTWLSGGTLVLIDEESRRDAQRLLRELTEGGVGRLFLPPAALQQLAEALGDGAPTPPLHQIITAGEQLHVTGLVARLFGRLGGCVLHNHYGPSESHVVTEFVLAGDPAGWPASVPIGRPIDNARIYLLDSRMQPVPVGVPGELYIGGHALARGYVRRPELTAERFLPDPFSAAPGARLYKTGDQARYRPDGNIEFLGRLDQQVKLRGFRIEPGEVEVVLSQHPAVKEAVVAVYAAASGDKRLAAYYVTHDGSRLSTTELRRFLTEKLPDFMIPNAFVQLEGLPLSPNGKLDRRALPDPDQQRPELAHVLVPPRTQTEQSLAAIWSEVLGVEGVGVHDNFFELGGHSLLATQVVSRVRDALHVELPLRSLFEAPTVAELAVRVVCNQAEQANDEYLTALLGELERMSAEEAQAKLDAEA
jgi:amino acid adenylation domain-containing protein